MENQEVMDLTTDYLVGEDGADEDAKKMLQLLVDNAESRSLDPVLLRAVDARKLHAVNHGRTNFMVAIFHPKAKAHASFILCAKRDTAEIKSSIKLCLGTHFVCFFVFGVFVYTRSNSYFTILKFIRMF